MSYPHRVAPTHVGRPPHTSAVLYRSRHIAWPHQSHARLLPKCTPVTCTLLHSCRQHMPAHPYLSVLAPPWRTHARVLHHLPSHAHGPLRRVAPTCRTHARPHRTRPHPSHSPQLLAPTGPPTSHARRFAPPRRTHTVPSHSHLLAPHVTSHGLHVALHGPHVTCTACHVTSHSPCVTCTGPVPTSHAHGRTLIERTGSAPHVAHTAPHVVSHGPHVACTALCVTSHSPYGACTGMAPTSHAQGRTLISNARAQSPCHTHSPPRHVAPPLARPRLHPHIEHMSLAPRFRIAFLMLTASYVTRMRPVSHPHVECIPVASAPALDPRCLTAMYLLE